MNVAIVDVDPKRIEICKEAVASLAGCQICWHASSAGEAVAKAAINTPNLILMGIDLALETVESIMNDSPCTILVLTDSVSTSSGKVFKAMGHGALDVVKIDPQQERESFERLRNKMLMVQLLLGTETGSPKKKRSGAQKVLEKQYPPLIIIGASTGGPAALATLLNGFPDECSFAFVVVQHVDATFAAGLAKWLERETGFSVSTAKSGCRPQSGKVLIAAADNHLVMNRNHQMFYTPYPIEKPYRPSVDIFFSSVAVHWPEVSTAVLLTGMGNDGALGMKKLVEAGWHTIAEHESSCVVFGMPKAAIEAGAAKEVLPIEEIGPSIIQRETKLC